MRIDLNADVGEGKGDDEALLPLVTSASVACGFHAGDPEFMARTVAAAARAGVAVGAHPSFPDREGFGRRPMRRPPEAVFADVLYQIGALQAVCRARGVRLVHVKPHGALYNQAAADPELARAIACAVRAADPGLVLVGLASSRAMREAAEASGLRYAAEAFADRRYEPDGTLVPRGAPTALVAAPADAAAQAVGIATRREVVAADGSTIRLSADTLCLHGDTPGATDIAHAVRRALEAAGVTVTALEA
ncbi:MAG TPA: 5-oxoprolinase subunit PxpA [Vicinamibacteria bacterium]|nr:5-oxoprolinase subunit PxpA [Vicinamibacteria bacterium]